MPAKKDFLFDPKRNPLYREDYRPSEYKITKASLGFVLREGKTDVNSWLTVTQNPATKQHGPLVLNGENLTLETVMIADPTGLMRKLDPSEYLVTDKHLIILHPPARDFKLFIATSIKPEENTALSGLYAAGDILTTQCEAQGFRRITYFLDRPDNLAVFDVTIDADKTKYPVLLSNGNGDFRKTEDSPYGNNMHRATWNDPWPKPSYLFALVAGDLNVLEDTFTTMSGRKVDLRIFVQDGYEDKIQWAMESIKRSMKWDEQRYGREYDLDCFHIVAVDKFNAGAMENKGLNIFNVKYLVGTPETSTDDELIDIEAVIAHEYFHNWTGDRVTVRDWFELTLKEGLTVLRDRQFTEDMHSQKMKRIDDAILLRSSQFMEDSSPMSHPIRPDMVEEFDNIYTGTIYEKGSHVLDMLHTMMGEKTWRLANDEYFNRFDGKAVSCDDYINVMEEISGIDLKQFRRWYSQSGTPEISYTGEYDAANKVYKLTLTQETKPTADQSSKESLHIPVAVGLIGESGKDAVPTQILHLTEKTQTFEFTGVNGPVVPSVLRNFSAPVKVVTQPTEEELVFRMAHDSDAFNKYEAAERLMVITLHKLIHEAQVGRALSLPQSFLDAYKQNVDIAVEAAQCNAEGKPADLAFAALMLQMPAYNIIIQDLKTLDPDAVHDAVNFMKNAIANEFHYEFKKSFDLTATPESEKYDVIPAQVGRRNLNGTCLSFISKYDEPGLSTLPAFVFDKYKNATNMTEKLAALGTLVHAKGGEDLAGKALQDFYDSYKDNNNLIDKWLMMQAAAPGANAIERVKSLMSHPAYDETNPNKVSYLIGGLIGGNPTAFHNKDGSGYKFLADTVIRLNDVNAKTATNLSKRFAQFKRYDSGRQQLMIAEMERIMAVPTIDVGIKEILGKALDTVKKPTNDNKPSAGFGKVAGK